MIKKVNDSLDRLRVAINSNIRAVQQIHAGSVSFIPEPEFDTEVNLEMDSTKCFGIRVGECYRPIASVTSAKRLNFVSNVIKESGGHVTKIIFDELFEYARIIFRTVSMFSYEGKRFYSNQFEIKGSRYEYILKGICDVIDVIGLTYLESNDMVLFSENITRDFTHFTVPGSYNKITVMSDDTEYDITKSHRVYLNVNSIPCVANNSFATEYVGLSEDPTKDKFILLRNIADKTANKCITGHPRGWESNNDYYKCVAYLHSDKNTDFGPKHLLIDGKKRKGFVYLERGFHEFLVFKDSWADYTTTDSLSPFNHKKLIESFGIVAQYRMKRIPLSVLKNKSGKKLPYYSINDDNENINVYSPLSTTECNASSKYSNAESFVIMEFEDPPSAIRIRIEHDEIICPRIIYHNEV